MILIVDSGSTKTDWALVANGVLVERIFTMGSNPFFQTKEEISNNIAKNIVPKLVDRDKVSHVYFYGAGCTTQEKKNIVYSAIANYMNAELIIESDLLGAARALCGEEEGIACILGTGSNSCLYDGSKIIENISPLGYILGDEGSGAVLGKLLVGACLKNQLPSNLKSKFLDQFKLTPNEILDKVYGQAFPNRFLASLSPFLLENIEQTEIYQLVLDSFRDFFVRNVMQYPNHSQQIHFVGSIAYYYRDVLERAAQSLHLEIGIVTRTPMDGLLKFHMS